ncbi:hypothetical protein LCM23_08015 [Cytobacillus kochii]|uniref:hypothetical protein n=1 Tax=Cytobacillus kochii TaxID=859143 RepID=UPI001CD676C0|nr:hypothetical protein [Cytobacillus kochii]MCA1026036.1 hypothetical protein [Cytobacillus kochii]
MKRIILFTVTFMCLFFISACSEDSNSSSNADEKEVKEFLSQYKSYQYTIENPKNPPTADEIGEKVKPFLSDEEYEKQFANRAFDIPAEVASKTNNSIALDDVTLEKVESEEESEKYKYTLHLIFSDNGSEESIDRKGEITVKTNNEMKITRDWENRNNEIDDLTF